MGVFDVTTVSDDGADIPILQCAGELDTQSAPVLRRLLWDLLTKGQQVIILQMDAVDYVDSSGLGILVAALRQANETSGTIAIAGVKPSVARVLRITGLDKIFPVYGSVDEAMAAMLSPNIE